MGDFCVMLALEILICAKQTAVSRASQALNSPHINHPQGRGVIQNPLAGNPCNPCNPCDPCFFAKGAKDNRGDRKNRRVFFERWLFSGRGEALRRRVAGEMVAHSNLFESGLAVRQPDYLQR